MKGRHNAEMCSRETVMGNGDSTGDAAVIGDDNRIVN